MTQVFISYSRKDIIFVEQFAADLKNAGLDVWYDVSSLRGGSRWRFEIEKALRTSQYVIFILSPDSINSEWVEREFLFASNLKLGLLPLMYRFCELPLNYLNLNYIDVQGDNYRHNFGEILNALGSQSASLPFQKEVTSPPPKPLPTKMKVRPVFFVAALVMIGLLICSGLLVRGYYSIASQKVTPTIPTVAASSTPIGTAVLTPSSLPLVSDTPLPAPAATFWISYDSDPSGNRDIFLIDPDTGQQRGVITDPSHDKVGTWSPDGKLLAFESNRGNSAYYQIYVFDNEQGSLTRLTEFADCSNWAPTWSPDGNKIVFYSNCEDDQRDIYVMNKDGKGRKNLTHIKGDDKFPVFSPNEDRITFTSTRNGKNQIFLMDPNGSDQKFIADGCSSSFSPDGKWLWFSTSTSCEDGELVRVEIGDTNVLPVGTVPGRNPSLSPDGRSVVFQSNDHIWIMDIDGSNPEQLTFGSELDGAPTWKP